MCRRPGLFTGGGGPPGSADPQALSGTTTLRQVEEDYGVPAEWLLDKFGLPADTDREKPIRDLLKPRGREVQEARDAIAEYRRSQH